MFLQSVKSFGQPRQILGRNLRAFVIDRNCHGAAFGNLETLGRRNSVDDGSPDGNFAFAQAVLYGIVGQILNNLFNLSAVGRNFIRKIFADFGFNADFAFFGLKRERPASLLQSAV